MTATETEAVEPRNGNKAPDWGHNYGIRELWSEIAPGLFVGGTADSDHVGLGRDFTERKAYFNIHERAEITTRDFDAVVTMYAWARPVDWGVEELRWGIMDSEQDGVDMDGVLETAEWAFRRWQAGKRVLIRCQAGLNRSSFIAAFVLMRSGLSASEAIDKIRRTRSTQALFNQKFERIIREFGS
jgi:hypothetical protein